MGPIYFLFCFERSFMDVLTSYHRLHSFLSFFFFSTVLNMQALFSSGLECFVNNYIKMRNQFYNLKIFTYQHYVNTSINYTKEMRQTCAFMELHVAQARSLQREFPACPHCSEDTERSLCRRMHSSTCLAWPALRFLTVSFCYEGARFVVCFLKQTFAFLIHHHGGRAGALKMTESTHSWRRVSWWLSSSSYLQSDEFP